MKRCFVGLALVPMLIAAAVANEPTGVQDGETPAAEAVKANPNSTEAINAYMSEAVGAILGALESDPADAEARLEAMTSLLDSLEPTAEEAQEMLARAKSVAPILEQRIELSRTSLDELQDRLRENPDDTETLVSYREKLVMQLGSMAYTDPVEANTVLANAKAFLAEVEGKATAQSKPSYAQTNQILDQLSGTIESNLSREALVGEDAAPLSVEAWVNGEPLTDSDLEGKVVLLDFWAVWCGPCVATFPHLIEWDEQYRDKGLVIIGLTSYYQFRWDEQNNQAVPAPDTTPEQERAMLEQFAEHHGLTHRFAIQQGEAMSEYYQVSGIPQAVVIDQEGKVRMIRVGSGEQNANAISGLLEELLGAPAKAGE